MDVQTLSEVCDEVAEAVLASLETVEDRRARGSRPGQYALDLVADEAALAVLERAGLDVLSEESGLHRFSSGLTAVVDPVDGSTNASRGVPWYATSICVLDEKGPLVALVDNLATGERYRAVRGHGSTKNGEAISPSGCTSLRQAVVALSGYPQRHLGWAQFRAFGAAALELCAVADGSIDAFTVGGVAHLAPWDYLGGLLVCAESGAQVFDLDGRELVVVEPGARRAVAGAATAALAEELAAAARAGAGPRGGEPPPPRSAG